MPCAEKPTGSIATKERQHRTEPKGRAPCSAASSSMRSSCSGAGALSCMSPNFSSRALGPSPTSACTQRRAWRPTVAASTERAASKGHASRQAAAPWWCTQAWPAPPEPHTCRQRQRLPAHRPGRPAASGPAQSRQQPAAGGCQGLARHAAGALRLPYAQLFLRDGAKGACSGLSP
jgi:hypothetical protein